MRLVDMFEAVEGNAEEKLAGQISLTENWLVAMGYTSLKRPSRAAPLVNLIGGGVRKTL